MIAFTLINVALILVDSDMFFLFSATIPYYIAGFGAVFADELGNSAWLIGGGAVALFGILLYFLCWLLSKRARAWILVALILFLIDSAFLVFLVVFLAEGFDAFFLIDIAFQVWILFYLFIGTRAWAQLRKATPEELNAALEGISTDEEQSNNQAASNVLQDGNRYERLDDPPQEDRDEPEDRY